MQMIAYTMTIEHQPPVSSATSHAIRGADQLSSKRRAEGQFSTGTMAQLDVLGALDGLDLESLHPAAAGRAHPPPAWAFDAGVGALRTRPTTFEIDGIA